MESLASKFFRFVLMNFNLFAIWIGHKSSERLCVVRNPARNKEWKMRCFGLGSDKVSTLLMDGTLQACLEPLDPKSCLC